MGNKASTLKQHGYILLEEIEQRAFSNALRVKREKDGQECVLKVLHKSVDVMNEVKVLQDLKHPFIVEYQKHLEDDINVFIVMEYCEGGDLSQKILKQKGTGEYFPEDKILTWVVEICMALEHVHGKNILHRDIKPENIFLDKNGTIRLGDFGLAKLLERYSGYARTAVGTNNYLSPEIIEEDSYGKKSDVWALGCVLYELCEHKRAFPEENKRKLFNEIADGPYPSISGPFSTDLQDLVRDLLQKNPVDRPSASDILRKPFLLGILIQKTKGKPEELLQKLEELDGVADGLERVHFGTKVGSLSGGVIAAAGGITTLVGLGLGLALTPFTGGASLIVTGVGIGVAAAGSVTGAVSNVTNMVNERIDRRTIENIIRECEANMLSLVTCLQHIENGFRDVKQSRPLNVGGAARVLSSIGGLAKLVPAVQAFQAASQAVRLGTTAQMVTGVFAGLFLALDIFFIIDDSREIHAMRQNPSNKYTKMEEESEELLDEASAGPRAISAAMTQEGSSASYKFTKMEEDVEELLDEPSAGPKAISAAMTQEGSSASNKYTKMEEESEELLDEPSAGPKASSAEGALKTREFIKKIRDASAELKKWLANLEPLYATITELEEAYINF